MQKFTLFLLPELIPVVNISAHNEFHARMMLVANFPVGANIGMEFVHNTEKIFYALIPQTEFPVAFHNI